MRIICPHCGFNKEIAAEQIPANVVRVTCPTCRQPFSLTENRSDQAESVEEVAASVIGDRTTEATAATAPEPGAEPGNAEPAHSAPISAAEPASIGARYAAMLIDAMLVLIMILSMRFGISLLGNGIPLEGRVLLNLTFTLFALVLGFTYHTLFIGICGQTPGKRLMRIRVIAVGQATLTYPRAMLREVLGKTLSSPLLLGYIMALFHPQRLAAHDKIADTCVVKFDP